MRLYIKQKVFSWNDKFTVKDAYGNDRYFVEGELFSWGKKLHIYDAAGREAALLRQEVWSFMPRYDVYIDGRQAARISRKFSFLYPKYVIEGPNWEADGSFWEHEYKITQNGSPIATMQKEWMSWGDCYELDIADPAQEILALAVVLTIDCVQAASNNN